MARILIVDDSAATRIKMKLFLMQAGHEVVAEAVNGLQAFKEYEKHLPDLVTMDITMPIMDGISSVKKIVDIFPDAKIVIISVMTQKHMIFAALQNGAKHYIIKPIEPDRVFEVINKVLAETSDSIASPQKELIPSLPLTQEKEPSSSANLLSEQPFSLEEKDGVFIVNISKNITQQSIRTINKSLEELLSANPQIIVFNFGDIEYISNDILEDISSFMVYFSKLYKTINVISTNRNFIRSLKRRNVDVFNNIYSNISEIPQ